ncbi:MAG: alpha/beta hydrolase [Myxococcales bacterium]|nr:alpha/beta hydrolase [Myxococcales bacterium]
MSITSALARWRPPRLLDVFRRGAGYVLPPPPGEFATVRGERLHYRVSGPEGAPPLLLVHGLLASTQEWEQVRPAFDSRYRVYAIDLPGHGYSDKRDGFSMELPDMAEVLAGFCETLGLGRVMLVGQSMGGAVSIVVASRHRQVVDRLVLVDPISYPFVMPLKGQIGVTPLLGRFVVRFAYNRTTLRDFMRNDVYFNKARCSEEEVDRFLAHLDMPGGRAAIHRAMQATANVGWLYDDIINVNLPTHIIWGQDDKLIPTKLAPRLHKDIRGSTLDVIPYCGHSPMTEKPDRFAKSVLRFFGEPR